MIVATVPRLSVQAQGAGGSVETVMHHVDYHVDSTLVMQIDRLRGRLVPARAGGLVVFDDPASFVIEIDSATIALRMTALSDLLDRYVFHYKGTPLKGLKASVDSGGRLKQSGRLHGLPFSIIAEMSVTSGGELRLHPVTIHVLGISAGGLLRTFGLSLQKMANVRQAPGVRIEKNDLYLTPAAMLPPPLARGHLVAAVARDSTLTIRFAQYHAGAPVLTVPDAGATNYLYFRGASLRFGRLTMTPADLLVVDHEPATWFDFWLARYQRQLVAGVSHTTPPGGLITEWPDFRSVKR
ncbi:MAG TPA: hypothetical protein VGM77_01675 [Gemmatimonadales bacterium]